MSLLAALREVYRRAPDDSRICDMMKQLQARGFDVGALTAEDQALRTNATISERKSVKATPEHTDYDYESFAIENTESLLAQLATPQTVSDVLWNFNDATTSQVPQQDLQQNIQPKIPQEIHLDISPDMQHDASFNLAYPDNETLTDPFVTNSTDLDLSLGLADYTDETYLMPGFSENPY